MINIMYIICLMWAVGIFNVYILYIIIFISILFIFIYCIYFMWAVRLGGCGYVAHVVGGWGLVGLWRFFFLHGQGVWA